MTTSSRRIVPRRRLAGRYQRRREVAVAAQAALFLGLPFLKVGGESALRIDVPSQQILFFGGRLGLDELFVVLAITVFALFAFAAITFLWGRVWCGYACPQTALAEVTRFVTRKRGPAGRVLVLAAVGAISLLVAADLLWFFVPPADFLARLRAGTLGPVLGWSWGVLAVVLFLDLAWMRHAFCARVCPYARLQGILFDRSTLVLAFDPGRRADCGTCSACVRACPVDVDLREGLHDSCIACGVCADRCEMVQGARGREPSIAYSFGEIEEGASEAPSPAGRRRFRPRMLARPAVLGPGLAALGALVLTMALTASRSAFTLTVLPDPDHLARVAGDGIEGGVLLALENRQPVPVVFDLRLESAAGLGAVEPHQIELAAREHRRVPATVHLAAPPPGPHSIELLASGAGGAPVRAGARLVVVEGL